jgi:PAS domain S-box-containing protein
VLLFLSIAVWQNFPACWIAGTGPTPFAIAGGYLVPFILAAGTGFLYRKREHLHGGVWQQLAAALVFQIPVVLAFTFFDPAAGIVPVLGYLSLLLSAWLFYRVFVLIGLTLPYDQILGRMQSDEDRLTQGERKYRTLFENMLEGFAYCRMIYDEEGRPSDWVYLDVNKAFVRLTGLENIQGKRVLEAIPDIRALTPELFDTYGRVASSGVPESFEINFLPLKKWLRVSVSSPEKGYFVAVFEDITERKQTDVELRRARDFYLKILDDFPNPVWRADVNAKCDYFNRDWLEFTGRSLAQELGDGWTRGVHPDDLDRCVKIYLDSFHARQPFTMEYRLRYHDGTYHWLLDSGKPFYTPEGVFAGYIGSCYDIQARKQAEEAFRIANSKLNLLSSITRHDINNQLLTLKAYLELSKNSLADPAKTAEYIIKEERAADAIGRQIVFTKEYQDLGVKAPDWQSVEACVQKALAALPLRDVRVDSSVGSLEVYADPLLEKVFYNLIDNALRYGGMKMTTIRIASRETERGLVISVEDNGSGIAPQDRKRLFERGFGHNTGLGLFLSREILAITGMTIAETGEPGSGARFEIAVPRGAWRVAGGETAGSP